jgi:protein involved in polysaccharide export with SLBB domain
MRLKDAIEGARGFAEFADGAVGILHRDGMTERYSLREAWSLTNNPALKPGDRIHNPRQLS